jgi:hypothetical protein
MTDGDGQSIGSVVRAGNILQAQKKLHHALHLIFRRAAVAGYRLFDLGRLIFLNGQAGVGDS